MTSSRLGFFALTLFLIASASGFPTTYTLVGVTFDDGGTASGFFTFDPVTNLYSNVNVTTTTGTTRSGATYQFVCGQDVASCTGVAPDPTAALYLTTSAANQTGNPGFAIFFTGVGGTPAQGLGSAPRFDVSNSSLSVGAIQEGTCVDAACSAPTSPSRSSVAGFVVAVLDPFQISYSSNLNVGDSYLNFTNSGATVANGVSQDLCINLYAFDPQEELISCCTCTVTPNGLVSLSVIKSLISNPLTPAIPTAVVVKAVASVGACNASAVTTPAHGLLAWGTTLHQNSSTASASYSVTETAFTKAFLTAPELAHITSTCGFIQADGSKFGICGGCPSNGLGSSSSTK